MSARTSARAIVPAALTFAILCAAPFGLRSASASDDATRNKFARNDCVRGKFKDYHRQGEGGDPAAGYTGRVFKLSQDFPTVLPPMEKYPWLKIPFKNGGPVDPRAYLQALLDYGLEGNTDVDFYVEDNKTAEQIASSRHYEIELVRSIIRMVERSEYKRQQAAPGLKISEKAFGVGRRFPVAAKWEI